MDKRKTILISIIIGLIIAITWFLLFARQKTSLSNPQTFQSDTKVQNEPSQTLIEYADPSGFSFSYPDNLSIIKNDLEDDSSYADLQLSSKEVNGSLNLKISDSKYKSLEEWIKLNKGVTEPKAVKLGTLAAIEIKTSDRLLLGALDQGIFFSIEIPLVEEDFWRKVYFSILGSFAFVAPEASTTLQDSTSDVSFEGEEVVE